MFVLNLALGSAAGLDDVVQFTLVIAANQAVARSLALNDGEIYYVTVRGEETFRDNDCLSDGYFAYC